MYKNETKTCVSKKQPRTNARHHANSATFTNTTSNTKQGQLLLSKHEKTTKRRPILKNRTNKTYLSNDDLSPLRLSTRPLRTKGAREEARGPTTTHTYTNNELFTTELTTQTQTTILQRCTKTNIHMYTNTTSRIRNKRPSQHRRPCHNTTLSKGQTTLLPPPPRPLTTLPRSKRKSLRTRRQ